MKLARPDVFHPRIVFAGCPQHLTGDIDDAGLLPALRQRGLHARWLSWDDPETAGAELVILRATRDYAQRRDEFRAWTTGVANLLNTPATVAWNLDAQYLRDLESAGVPTLVDGPSGQPVDPAALIFFGGQRSHAFTDTQPVEPDFEFWDVGYAAIASAAEHVGIGVSELLYARVDVDGGSSRGGGGVQVAGLDLVAPSLGWGRLDGATRELAQRRFALAVGSACERLGLGPFSHRNAHRRPQG
jgi:hypothetical protein